MRLQYKFLLLLVTLIGINANAETYPVDTIIVDHDNHVGGSVLIENISGFSYDLRAVPITGYIFKKWSDNVTTNPRSYTQAKDEKKDSVLWAIFAKEEDVVLDNGSIEVGVADVSIPSFTLTANPNDGFDFYRWDNGLKTAAITYKESDGNRYPYFVPNLGVLNFDTINHPGGKITLQNINDKYCELVATPNAGYSFLKWADGNEQNPRPYTHTGNALVDEIVFAVFTKNDEVTVPGGYTKVDVVDQTVPSFNLTAQNTSCSEFLAWFDGRTSKTIPYVETDGNKTPLFDFGDNKVDYNVENESGGTVTVTPDTCSFALTATPTAGWHFTKWSDDVTTATRVLGNVETELYAYFAKSAFEVDGVVYPSFEEAVTAAGGTKPITLRDDISDNLEINSVVNLDGQNHTIANLTITTAGSLSLSSNLKVNNLYLATTTGASSQLRDVNNLSVLNDAFVDIQLESGDVASPDKWYGFAVPFEVDVESGISRASGSASHIYGTDYAVLSYNGTTRANTGKGWIPMYSGTLQPGIFYMLGIGGTQNVWRFKKNKSAGIGGATEHNLTYYTGSMSAAKEGGWNAMGNSLTMHANAAVTGIDYCQVYDNELSTYIVKRFDKTSFVMSCPFFIQVGETGKTLVLEDNAEDVHSSLYAPKREVNTNSFCYELTLSNGKRADALYLTASENAQNSYVVGKDVVKLMGGTNTHYIWSNAYGMSLCAEDAQYTEDAPIDYAVSLFAPVAGTYTLRANGPEQEIYLLDKGIQVAELHNNYSLTLPKGTSQFIVRVNNVRTNPDLSTDVELVGGDATKVDKIIRDGVMYIIRGAHIYDAQGQMVK